MEICRFRPKTCFEEAVNANCILKSNHARIYLNANDIEGDLC